MAGLVFVAVLAAAVVHASWNAIAKLVPDQLVSAGLLASAGMGAGAAGAAVLPPPAPDSWPFIAVSSVLQAVYLLLLVHAYRHGEFGQVYPLARGLPPPLVTVVSWTLLGERLTLGQLGGVAVVSAALAALVFAGGRAAVDPGLGLAAVTGVVIAAYTLVDGVGVRQSGHAVSYAMWLFFLQGWLVLAASRLRYGRGFGPALVRSARLGLAGGVLALVAYATVLWAQSQAPLALVSALRETSVLFAGVIGALVFRERVNLTRLAATTAAVVGIILLQTT
jgi:drug/metabolite transporter (DMT)-like permease